MSRSPEEPEVLERFDSALELVDKLARQLVRTTGGSLQLDELRSFGREGLLDAARRYDPDRGVPFKGYASFRVRGAMLDGVRSASRLPRRVHRQLRALESSARLSEGTGEDLLAAPPAPGSGAGDAERALDAQLASMATAMAIGLAAPLDSSVPDGGSDPEESFARAELLKASGSRSIRSRPRRPT